MRGGSSENCLDTNLYNELNALNEGRETTSE